MRKVPARGEHGVSWPGLSTVHSGELWSSPYVRTYLSPSRRGGRSFGLFPSYCAVR